MTDTADKFAKGLAVVQKLFPDAAGNGPAMPDDFTAYTIAHLFGDVWQGAGLEIEQRSLITCVVLVALNREAEQRLHFVGARNLGIPRARIEAMITHVAHYAGWPVAVSAFRVLEDVWPEEQDKTAFDSK